MAKYKIANGGVYDSELDLHIPESVGNRHWQEYQAWLTDPANTPDPADPVAVTTALIEDEEKRRVALIGDSRDMLDLINSALGLFDKRLSAIEASLSITLDTADQTTLDTLRAKKSMVDAIKQKSEALKISLPSNYKDDVNWTS